MEERKQRQLLRRQLVETLDVNETLVERIEQLKAYIWRAGFEVPRAEDGLSAPIVQRVKTGASQPTKRRLTVLDPNDDSGTPSISWSVLENSIESSVISAISRTRDVTEQGIKENTSQEQSSTSVPASAAAAIRQDLPPEDEELPDAEGALEQEPGSQSPRARESARLLLSENSWASSAVADVQPKVPSDLSLRKASDYNLEQDAHALNHREPDADADSLYGYREHAPASISRDTTSRSLRASLGRTSAPNTGSPLGRLSSAEEAQAGDTPASGSPFKLQSLGESPHPVSSSRGSPRHGGPATIAHAPREPSQATLDRTTEIGPSPPPNDASTSRLFESGQSHEDTSITGRSYDTSMETRKHNIPSPENEVAAPSDTQNGADHREPASQDDYSLNDGADRSNEKHAEEAEDEELHTSVQSQQPQQQPQRSSSARDNSAADNTSSFDRRDNFMGNTEGTGDAEASVVQNEMESAASQTDLTGPSVSETSRLRLNGTQRYIEMETSTGTAYNVSSIMRGFDEPPFPSRPMSRPASLPSQPASAHRNFGASLRRDARTTQLAASSPISMSRADPRPDAMSRSRSQSAIIDNAEPSESTHRQLREAQLPNSFTPSRSPDTAWHPRPVQASRPQVGLHDLTGPQSPRTGDTSSARRVASPPSGSLMHPTSENNDPRERSESQQREHVRSSSPVDERIDAERDYVGALNPSSSRSLEEPEQDRASRVTAEIGSPHTPAARLKRIVEQVSPSRASPSSASSHRSRDSSRRVASTTGISTSASRAGPKPTERQAPARQLQPNPPPTQQQQQPRYANVLNGELPPLPARTLLPGESQGRPSTQRRYEIPPQADRARLSQPTVTSTPAITRNSLGAGTREQVSPGNDSGMFYTANESTDSSKPSLLRFSSTGSGSGSGNANGSGRRAVDADTSRRVSFKLPTGPGSQGSSQGSEGNSTSAPGNQSNLSSAGPGTPSIDNVSDASTVTPSAVRLGIPGAWPVKFPPPQYEVGRSDPRPASQPTQTARSSNAPSAHDPPVSAPTQAHAQAMDSVQPPGAQQPHDGPKEQRRRLNRRVYYRDDSEASMPEMSMMGPDISRGGPSAR